MNFDLDRSMEILQRSPATLGRAANLELLCSWKLTARDLDLPGEHPSLVLTDHMASRS